MTDIYFFDSDCLWSFFCVNNESILSRLYKGQIVLPAVVYQEINKVHRFKQQLQNLINSSVIRIESMVVGSDEARLYFTMTQHPEKGMPVIDDGEAAAIAMAYYRKGILVSSNYRDVGPYVAKLHLPHKGTGDIFKDAVQASIITPGQGEVIWRNMISKGRRLPYPTLSEYLSHK